MTVMSATFGALPGVQFMHAICCFDSGSQQSNASNSARFGVEMKELQPLEADHSKLKANFAGLRNGVRHAVKFRSPLARLRNSPEASRYL